MAWPVIDRVFLDNDITYLQDGVTDDIQLRFSWRDERLDEAIVAAPPEPGLELLREKAGNEAD